MRRTLRVAGLEDHVEALVGRSNAVARLWYRWLWSSSTAATQRRRPGSTTSRANSHVSAPVTHGRYLSHDDGCYWTGYVYTDD